MNGGDWAVPVKHYTLNQSTGESFVHEATGGFSKREYIAIEAMKALISAETKDNNYSSPQRLCVDTVAYADKMIEVLS